MPRRKHHVTSPHPATKRSVGRPRKEVDLKLAADLVRIQCTADEVCGVLDVSPDTLDRRLKEAGWNNFADFYERHAAEGRASLRRDQFKAARKGNSSVLIWLGRQYLGQTDRREISGPDGGPIESRVETTGKRFEDMTRQELEAELHARSAGS